MAHSAEHLARRELVRSSGFTPSVRDLDMLVVLATGQSEEDRADAIRALLKLGDVAARALSEFALKEEDPSRRAMAHRALGRLARPLPEVVGTLIAAVRDPDSRASRQAIVALGRGQFRNPNVETALVQAWGVETRIEHRRSIAESLGKIGSQAALDALRSAPDASDPELRRLAARAELMLTRTIVRESKAGEIAGDRPAPHAMDVVVRCRRGLERLVAEDLAVLRATVGCSSRQSEARVLLPTRIAAKLTGTLNNFLNASRLVLDFAFVLPSERFGEEPEAIASAVARALTSPLAREVFATWTSGPTRFRIAWSQGGHRRRAVWECARRVAEVAPDLINDPTESLWTALVNIGPSAVFVELYPSALPDNRFAYRRSDIPAASHPTIAAALARIAGAREDDVVWDPFVGSATELIERARLGPYRALFGTDIDPAALAAARENLDSASVTANLSQIDALHFTHDALTLVVTNPPLGRRVAREKGLATLLDRLLAHAAKMLVKGGRVAWISPFPTRARAIASAAGLSLRFAQQVDLGGFDAEIQLFVK